MAYFLVKFENQIYANSKLYTVAIAGSVKAFYDALAHRNITGTSIFDQVVYPVTPEQQKLCEQHTPVFQDFDSAIRSFNVVSKDTIKQIRENTSVVPFQAAVISIDRAMLPECFKYKYTTFFKVRDWGDGERKKYYAVSKMAAIKVCGFLYVALNAVDVRVRTPIIATLKD